MSVPKGAGIRTQAEVYAHKLFAPTRYAGAIRRTAILDRIFKDDCARIVLLQGPAGHGKSTALQQLKAEFESRGYLSGWLSFDEADNDARRFSIHMHALVAALLGSEAGAAVSGDDENSELVRRRRSDWMVDCLFRLGRPVAIFFDEFQTLRDKSILSFFRSLLERVPENVRILIGSRSVPELGLARLVVSNQALILRADDLRFSPAEVEQFFAASQDLAVSSEEREAIYSRTEGWPAALQLFRLALVSPQVRQALGDLGDYRPRELAEYLVENVLSLQPPQVQEFLLRTSLLNRLSAPLCDAVTGRGDSQEMLQQLERSGLFLRTLDSDLHWFRYHALFSSFLAEQQQALSAATALEVHRRAADWHLAHGSYEEAVHHFVACRDFTSAADTMNTWATRLTAGALLGTVERWYDQLPFEEVAKRPDLAIKIGYTLVFLRRYNKLKPLLQSLLPLQGQSDGGCFERTTNPDVLLSMAAVCADRIPESFQIVERVRIEGCEPSGFAAFELGAGANLVGYRDLARGDVESARHHLSLARAFSARGDASFSGGYTVGLTGVTLLMQGQLEEALESFRQGLAEQRMHLDGSFASAALVSCYIWGLYEANELDMVEALFAQYRELIADGVLLDFLAVAYLPMARTHDARGRPAKAMEVLDEAESIGHANGWERLVRLVQWERVRRWLVSGAVDRAQSLASRIPPAAESFADSWRLFSEDVEGESFGQIRLAIHTMDLDGAGRVLAREMGLQRDRVNRQIKLQLLDALLQERRGVRNAAHRSLRKALQLARPGHFVRCFIDEGESILQLLREEYQAIMEGANGREGAQFGADRDFVERILQASGTDLSRAPVTAVQPLEALTDREKEILVFLANGVSNKEMAGRIFVSENTVKFHLKNIYSKLAVANRLQAISAARQLGIVH
jgi:LuxR family maltose regulon positive regulatory protein